MSTEEMFTGGPQVVSGTSFNPPPPGAGAPVQAPSTPSFASPSVPLTAWLSLAVAALWLVVTVVVGVPLMSGGGLSTPSLPMGQADLTPSSFHSSYGGDAYTGIQNAASDTEHAVIAATNAQLASDRQLAEWNADFQAELAKAQAAPVARGLGLVLIGTGVGPFAVTLALFSRKRDSAGAQTGPSADAVPAYAGTGVAFGSGFSAAS